MTNATNELVKNYGIYSFRHDFMRIFVITLAYFFAHYLSYYFPDSGNFIVLIWPAGGIGLAGFLLIRKKLWPYLILAFCISGISASMFLRDRSFLASFGYMMANMTESTGCAALILYYSSDFQRFDRLREVLALVAGAICINAFSSSIGAYTAVQTTGATFARSWWSWYISDGLAILLVGPFLMSWFGNLREAVKGIKLNRVLEGVAFITIWVFICYIVFYQGKVFNYLKFRPYMLLDVGPFVLILEIDENCHKNYDSVCETNRINAISNSKLFDVSRICRSYGITACFTAE